MKILKFDKPKKIISVKKWKSITADGAPPGVYTPNMSKKDMMAWKAKYINGRVEIRKTFSKSGNYSQVLIVVSKDIIISMNGKTEMTFKELSEFNQAIEEAKIVVQFGKKKKFFKSARF